MAVRYLVEVAIFCVRETGLLSCHDKNTIHFRVENSKAKSPVLVGTHIGKKTCISRGWEIYLIWLLLCQVVIIVNQIVIEPIISDEPFGPWACEGLASS